MLPRLLQDGDVGCFVGSVSGRSDRVKRARGGLSCLLEFCRPLLLHRLILHLLSSSASSLPVFCTVLMYVHQLILFHPFFFIYSNRITFFSYLIMQNITSFMDAPHFFSLHFTNKHTAKYTHRTQPSRETVVIFTCWLCTTFFLLPSGASYQSAVGPRTPRSKTTATKSTTPKKTNFLSIQLTFRGCFYLLTHHHTITSFIRVLLPYLFLATFFFRPTKIR